MFFIKQMQIVNEKNKIAGSSCMSQFSIKQTYDFSVKMLFLGIHENTSFIICVIFQFLLLAINIRVTDKKPFCPLAFIEKNRN